MKKLSLFPYRAYGRVRDIGTLVIKDKATVESAQSEHKGDSLVAREEEFRGEASAQTRIYSAKGEEP